MIFSRNLFLLCTACLMAVAFIHASIAKAVSDKVICAVKIESDKSPVIDGRLDDECWGKADKVSDFTQTEPTMGGKPSDPTNVHILFDNERLYVGFRCFKENPDNILGSEMKRDGHFFQDDYVEVCLDTYHDNRNCYSFSINCLGTKVDKCIANEGSMRGGRRDDSSRAWDCNWDAAAKKDDEGWTAEIAIPFSELRFSRKGDGVWGINFRRANEEFEEENTWADVGENEMAVSRFGDLTGLTPAELVTSRPLEFKPYATIKPRISPDPVWESASNVRETLSTGLDVRYPSSTITWDFTLNPDFAQIEADPARINLEDVELRLSEKRPFFQEGMGLFKTPLELFYTRRAGVKDLKYGAKAVGKLGSYNIALLDCQSDDTEDDDEDDDDDDEEEKEDETKNNYFVLRTQRDVGSNSSIGILGVNKQKADGYNRMGSVDFNTVLPGDIRFIGQYAGSWKPDNNDDAYTLDMRRRGKIASFEVGYFDIGPDFEAESGYLPRGNDRRGFRGGAGFDYKRDAKIFKGFEGGFEYERLENYNNIKTNEKFGIDCMMRVSEFFIFGGPEWYQHIDEDDDKREYKDRTISFFTGWFPPRWVSIRARTEIGQRDEKDIFFTGPSVSISPTEKLKLEFSLERLDKEDERLKLNRRVTVSYQFTHQMFFRTTCEMSRGDNRNEDHRSLFVLYGWEYRPESHFFVVYTDNKERSEDAERIMFVKFSYLLKWNIF